MPKTISQDLRRRVVDYVAAGHSARAAAKHYKLSINFAIKLVRRWQNEGHIKPRFRGRPPGTGKLTPYHEFLRNCVKDTPDITLYELVERLEAEHGVSVYPASIHKVLVSLKYWYPWRSAPKKNSAWH